MGAQAFSGRVVARAAAAFVALCAVALALAAAAAPATAAEPTGRHLVTFERSSTARSSGALSAVLARTGVRRAGRGVPDARIATVRGGRAALARLSRDPSVQSVSVEWSRDLRRVPNDPALTRPETEFTTGVPPGTPIQWALARQGFPAAWDVTTGDGAIVAVIDSGLDGQSPELGPKVASADAVGAEDPLFDPDGHGSHVSGLACAATDNGIGVAGAGFGCRLAVLKLGVDSLTGGIRDEDVIAAIRLAVERGAQVINMSFGGGDTSQALSDALDFAAARGVVLVAAASNDDTDDQGAPAVELQPNDAADLAAGSGLVVTAAEFDDTRAGTGFGPQISLAAYGFFDDGTLGPPGLISTYPGNGTPFGAICDCRRTIDGDARYAYLAGTSMAVPQVAGLAALVSDLNAFLTLPEKLTLLKDSARGVAWGPELGWGIIDAGAAVDAARRVDRNAPASSARAKRRVRPRPGTRRARLRLRWSGSDEPGAPGLLPAGLTGYDVFMRRGRRAYRPIRAGTTRGSALLRLRPGVYRFYTRASDAAGNVEAAPGSQDVRVRVKRPRVRRR